MTAPVINFQAHRTKLERRLERKQLRDAAVLAARQPDAAASCTHPRQTFRETIRADNPKFTGSAHYVVKACSVCKVKRRAELVVQR